MKARTLNLIFATFFALVGHWQGKQIFLIWSDDLSHPAYMIAVPDVAPTYTL